MKDLVIWVFESAPQKINIGGDGSRSNGTKRVLNPDICKVHCYGGSTTLGDGVADDQTISAYLESKLNSKGSKKKVAVFNFGAGNHTSLHSTLRLLDHCFSGIVPDQAIFLNGYNDCHYSAGGADGVIPFFNEILKRSQDSEFRNTPISEIIELIPNSSKGSLAFDASSVSGELIATCLVNIKLRYASAVAIQDFIVNNFGVRILRFIEPCQALNCREDQKVLPRITESNPRRIFVGLLYKELENIGFERVFGRSPVVLTDIDQDKQSFPLYLDGAHFSPAMNELIAVRISNFLKLKRGLFNRRRCDPTAPAAKNNDLLDPYNYPLF